jgi:predicted HicB family RNase H-like nuclease
VNILRYNEFEGSAEVDTDRMVCFGKLLFIDDLVTYEAESVQALEQEFRAAVDDYLETCKQLGREPLKPCRGQFNVRVSPDLHRGAVRRAIVDKTSLNDVVVRALEAYLRPELKAGNERAAPIKKHLWSSYTSPVEPIVLRSAASAAEAIWEEALVGRH